MICNNCGVENKDNVRFCKNCGHKLDNEEAYINSEAGTVLLENEEYTGKSNAYKAERNGEKNNNAFCIYCGARLNADAMFCHKCGKPTMKNKENDVRDRYDSSASAKKASIKQETDSAKEQIVNVAKTLSEKIDRYETVKKWVFRICAAIAVFAIFLPIIDYGFYTMNVIEMVQMATEIGEISPVIPLGILAIIVHLALSILMFIFTEASTIRYLATVDIIILLAVRILPNMIMSASISSEIGYYGFGYNLIQYGSGWWVMFLPVLAIGIISWILSLKERAGR